MFVTFFLTKGVCYGQIYPNSFISPFNFNVLL